MPPLPFVVRYVLMIPASQLCHARPAVLAKSWSTATPCSHASMGRPRQWSFLIACLRSEEHTSELQSRENLVCRLLLEKKKITENTVGLHRYSGSLASHT